MKDKLLAVGIIASLILGVVAYRNDKPVYITQTQEGNKELGALTGPDIPYQYLRVGGVEYAYRSMSLKPATTTPCRLQAPSATSTLVRFSLQVNTATGTAATYDIATSTDGFSTTSPQIAKAVSIAASTQHTFTTMGTTTSLSNNGNLYNVIPPNSWLFMKTAGTGESGYTWGGTCQATFEVIR